MDERVILLADGGSSLSIVKRQRLSAHGPHLGSALEGLQVSSIKHNSVHKTGIAGADEASCASASSPLPS